MRIYADRLAEQLQRGLSSAYLLVGNEPLLLEESRQGIRTQAKQQGYEEVHRFTLDQSIEWDRVYDCFQAMSLFCAQQIVEIDIPESGVSATAAKPLLELIPLFNPQTLLIIVANKLPKAQEKTKWFSELSKQSLWVQCITPDVKHLPRWVANRCQQLGLRADDASIQMLAQWHEGNLLALKQSLEKLTLLYPDGQLTLIRVEEALSRHHHYTPFQWLDALLDGKAKRALKILHQLESEGVEITILLRTLQKELLTLIKLHRLSAQMPLGKACDQLRIWQSKRPAYHIALTRLKQSELNRAMKKLSQLELEVKTQYDRSSWPGLAELSIDLCQPERKVIAPL